MGKRNNYTNPHTALGQFKAQARKVNALLKSSAFSRMSLAERSRLLGRLRQMYQALKLRFGQRRLQRVLAGATLLIGLSVNAHAQNFLAPVQNPFGLAPAGSYFFQPEAADMDGDGDLDVFIGDDYNSFQYYENTGTATAPAFLAPDAQTFGLDSVASYYAYLALADIESDGDLDAFVGNSYTGVFYYVNVGAATAPNYDGPFQDTLGITTTAALQVMPELVDLDDDGDFDLFISNYNGQMIYHENTGTATDASFAAGDTLPFGIPLATDDILPTFGDLDTDGDFDLLYHTYPNTWVYQDNTGSATAPAFGTPQMMPFGLMAGYYFSQPVLADFDGDADLDLLHSEGLTNFQYYENGPAVSVDDGFGDAQLTLQPNPAVEFTKVTVTGGQLAEQATVEVYSMTGKRVMLVHASTNGGNLEETLPVSMLAAGSYVVRISSGEQVLQQRFTRQ